MQKLAEICVRRPVFATMLILALTVVGVFSFFTLGVDLFPRIDFPTITITVVNPGASPQEIETEITDRIEAAVNTISGIDELRSTSVEGVSQVFVTFVLEKDADVAAQEARDKISLILNELPETAEAPIVLKLDTDAAPILRIVVSAPRPLGEVNELAENRIAEKLESVGGVGRVEIVGGSRREIRIQVDPNRLRAFNVPVNQIVNAVRAQNLEIPGGRLSQGAREATVRTLGRIREVEDFNDLVIADRNGYAVKVRDLGRAVDTVAEQRTASLFNGRPAVSLIVSRQSGENTVAVADAIKQRLNEIRPTLPPDVDVEIAGDQSVYIRAAVNAVETHLIEGSLLASIVVFLFLWNFRSTLIAAIAIPTSIISTFGLMAALDYTLNQITMLALTLMVGIVIDDAIVVLENIYRFIEEKGMRPFDAAIEGTREIGLAVMATTLSLLAVFLPVGFMGGIVGRFMSSFGLTASFAIAVSLLVSFTLTPMLSARLIKPREDGETGRREDGETGRRGDENPQSAIRNPQSKEGRVYRRIDRAYTWMLEWSMARRKTIVLLSAVTILSIVPLFMIIGKNFLPDDDQAQLEISVRAAEGATLPATMTILERIAAETRKLPGVTDTLTTAGGGQQGAVNSGSIYVKLAPIEARDLSQQELMVRARALLGKFPAELRTSVQQVAGVSGGGFRNADIQFLISGPDIEKLTQYANELLKRMKTIPDVVDADTSVVAGKPEVRVAIDRQRAAELGVQVGDIAQALNTLVAGQEVSTFFAGAEDYEVRVRAAGEFRRRPEDLEQMIVASNHAGQSGWASLNDVVKIEAGVGPSSIDRLNRQRQVTLTANVKPGGSQAEVIERMNQFVKEMKLEPGYTTGLIGRSKELGRAGYYFALAFGLSFVFMYMVLAAQFESFIHPVTILLTLPLAVPFGILSLLVFGQTINIFSGLGLLLLFGIVKKNAILQIDHTNGLRKKGMERHAAIIQANRDRLRPILMTTIALVAGMLPLVISRGPGSGTNRSIGVLVVGGQSLCLLLTLLAVPVFYSLFEDLLELPFWRRMSNRWRALMAMLRERFAAPLTNAFRRRPRRMGVIIGFSLMLFAAPSGNGAEVIQRLDKFPRSVRSAMFIAPRQIMFPSSVRSGIWPHADVAPDEARGIKRRQPINIALLTERGNAGLCRRQWEATPANIRRPSGTEARSMRCAEPQQPSQAQQPSQPPPVAAPDYRAPLRPLPQIEQVGVNPNDQTTLTLEEAVMLALSNNRDINVSRINAIIAGFDLRAARGVFDPLFVAESNYEQSIIPVGSILEGGEDGVVRNKDLTGRARLGGSTPVGGGAYQVDFFSRRLTTDNQFVTLNPQYPSALTFFYAQPLWRNFRFDENRRLIEVAKKNLSLTDAQFRQQVIEIVTRVEQAYWELAFSLRNLNVQIEALRQARRQSESNRRLVKEGLLASIDIVEADAQVANFEQNVYRSQEVVTRADNTLKTLILSERTSPLWSRALTPTTPVSLVPPPITLSEAISTALTNRPELQQLQTTAEINEINTRFYRDQTRPQIDLVGLYTAAGLAGTPVQGASTPFGESLARLEARINVLSILAGLPPLPTPGTGLADVPPILIGGYGQSLSNLFGQKFPTTRVGLRISLPLFNRTAEAYLGRALAESTRITNQRERLEMQIEAEVRDTLQVMRSAEARLASAAAASSLAEQQAASESRKFQNGLSTVFLVLQRQTELLTARMRELLAQTDLNKSIAELQRVTGRTLEAHKIALRTETPAGKPGQKTGFVK